MKLGHGQAQRGMKVTAAAFFAALLSSTAATSVAMAMGGDATVSPYPLRDPTQLKMAQRQPPPPRQPDPTPPASATGAGRYALLREEGKESGCLVNLIAGGRAQLGPGCKDHGIAVFDPVNWNAGRNSITLRARAGHRVNFVYKADGSFQREPPDKRALGLRKY